MKAYSQHVKDFAYLVQSIRVATTELCLAEELDGGKTGTKERFEIAQIVLPSMIRIRGLVVNAVAGTDHHAVRCRTDEQTIRFDYPPGFIDQGLVVTNVLESLKGNVDVTNVFRKGELLHVGG
jgi:hypothetical protein